ncbi:mevalonate kinase [Acidobacteriota bacterium]
MAIETRAFARAGLLGNPSDGYFGKIIALTIKNFSAHVFLEKAPELIILPSDPEKNVYKNIADLSEETRLFGYYGGTRLLKAAIKKFNDYSRVHSIKLDDKNFSIRYETSIPRQLGLGGSSAIITAALRALMKFYDVDIPEKIQPSLILDAELRELGINAGYMDRVVQVYEGCVYMDLDKSFIEENGHGLYEKIDMSLLPDFFLAYKLDLGKVSGKVLNGVRKGYESGDRQTISILGRLADIAQEGKKALEQQELDKFFDLMNLNFDLRSKIMSITETNTELIQAARRCGASAKFAGSGGSIIGMYHGEEMFASLVSELGKLQAEVIRPLSE